jgi:hypothetical protein
MIPVKQRHDFNQFKNKSIPAYRQEKEELLYTALAKIHKVLLVIRGFFNFDEP